MLSLICQLLMNTSFSILSESNLVVFKLTEVDSTQQCMHEHGKAFVIRKIMRMLKSTIYPHKKHKKIRFFQSLNLYHAALIYLVNISVVQLLKYLLAVDFFLMLDFCEPEGPG